MSRARKIKDGLLNGVTWFSTGLSVFILIAVFIFVFKRGWSTFSFDLLKEPYWSENYNVSFGYPDPGTFVKPDNLPEGSFFSERYGFAVRDEKSREQSDLMVLTYMDPQSPLQSALNMQAGAAYNTAHQIGAEARIRKIEYFDADGKKHTAGLLGRENSEQMIETLDSKAESLAACFYQTAGGGVNGSLITTLILIGLTILIALPLGIGAAIYLNELAPSNKVTNLMRSSIEMLSGVPSIVFGLML